MLIEELELKCNDLSAVESFYSVILGLVVDNKSGERISFRAGRTKLIFKRTGNLKPVYHFAFNIPNNQISEALSWIAPKAEIIRNEGKDIIDFPNWNAESVYFYDSVGNILEFIARHDLLNSSGEPFSGNSILSIGEIAVATDDVPVFVENMINKHRLNIYQKQPMLPNFAALGDAEGLLIVSKTGRQWFPTDKIAEKLFTRLVLKQNGKKSAFFFHG